MVLRDFFCASLLCLSAASIAADSPGSAFSAGKGLYFYSYEVNADMRTALNLTPDRPLKFPRGFSMEFDFKLGTYGENFGYIFRIIGNDSLNIDFVSDIRAAQIFTMIVGNHASVRFHIDELKDYRLDRWIRIRLDCSVAAGSITLSIDGVAKSVDYRFNRIDGYRFLFGGNSHRAFSTNDVPPMFIKNIRLYSEKGVEVRNWEMMKHDGNSVYDNLHRDRAAAVNPLWEIDGHARWNRRRTLILPTLNPKIAYDRRGKRFFIVYGSKVIVYNTAAETVDTLTATSGVPFSDNCNQLIYDDRNDRLISYEFTSDRTSIFDLRSGTWTNGDGAYVRPEYQHHNRHYFSADSLLVTVGGYGFHQYFALLKTYDMRTQSWSETDLSGRITPRYLSSMGLMNDSLMLYFGGYGSATGRQHESPHNYYDLYTINARTGEVAQLWNIENVSENFTNSNSLIFNPAGRTFYALSYPNKIYESHIILREYSVDRPEYRELGDSIPYFFNDVKSYCDLFMPDDLSELLTLTYCSSGETGAETEVNVYSIIYPPLRRSEISQSEPRRGGTGLRILYTLIMLAAPAVLFFGLRRLFKKIPPLSKFVSEEEHETGFTKSPKLPKEPVVTPSVNLLGEFRILDCEGKNLSNGFTPTTKQFFLKILLASIKNKRGLTSEELRNIFWPDKDYNNARNNRNVNINRLRLLLRNVGNLNIAKENGYWTISGLGEVYCDYERITALIQQFNEKHEFDMALFDDIMDIARQGPLLPLYDAELADEYKSDYSSLIIEFLLETASLAELKNNLPLLLRISEVILLQDSIEESGISLKCKTLYRLGKKKQALQCYQKFSKEHQYLLGSETNLSFEGIIG
jgi:DNA-binding SARP family transcriptional activator